MAGCLGGTYEAVIIRYRHAESDFWNGIVKLKIMLLNGRTGTVIVLKWNKKYYRRVDDKRLEKKKKKTLLAEISLKTISARRTPRMLLTVNAGIDRKSNIN